jgi:hypothetical protein
MEYLGRKKEEALLQKWNSWARRRKEHCKKNGIPGLEGGRSTVRKMEYLGQNEPSRFGAGPQVEVGQLHNRHDEFF